MNVITTPNPVLPTADAAAGATSPAARLLRSHGEAFLAAVAALIEDDTPAALHRARVSARRLRAALRLFRSRLTGEIPRRLGDELRELLSLLSAARDHDVWVAKLRDWTPSAAPGLRSFLRRQLTIGREEHRKVRALIDEGACRSAVDLARALLDKDIPGLEIADDPLQTRRRMLRKLRRQFARLMSVEDPLTDSPAESVHAFRRACRRMRYWLEFHVELFGPQGRPLAARVKKICDALGDVRDCDLALMRVEKVRSPWVPGFRREVKKRRSDVTRLFVKRWQSLRCKKMRALAGKLWRA